jgi:hypothetical protein
MQNNQFKKQIPPSKFQNDQNISDSEDLMSEDSDADLLRDDQLVIDFMTTFSKIKNKTKDIYDEKTKFYKTKDQHLKGQIEFKKEELVEEPRNVKKLFLERMGKEDEFEEKDKVNQETPVEVQARIKEEFKNALGMGKLIDSG